MESRKGILKKLTKNRFDVEQSNLATILYLYLLHKPDYASNIASTFVNINNITLKARDKRILPSGYSDLTHRGRLSNILKSMEENRLIGNLGEQKTSGAPKIPYEINASILAMFIGKTMTGEKIIMLEGELLLKVIDIIRRYSPDIRQCIARILRLPKHDYVSTFVYCHLLTKDLHGLVRLEVNKRKRNSKMKGVQDLLQSGSYFRKNLSGDLEKLPDKDLHELYDACKTCLKHFESVLQVTGS